MIFTMEQYEDLELDSWELGEYNSQFSTREDRLKLFNSMRSSLQGLAVSWGAGDSVFRDDTCEWLRETITGVDTSDSKPEPIEQDTILPEYDFDNEEDRERFLKDPAGYVGVIYVKELPKVITVAATVNP